MDALTLGVLGQHILQSIQGLYDAHSGPAGPMRRLGAACLKWISSLPSLMGLSRASINTSIRAGTAVVKPKSLAAVIPSTTVRSLILASNRPDDGPIVGGRELASQRIFAWQVIQATVNATQFVRVDQALQRFVDGRTIPKINEVPRGPDFILAGRDPIDDMRFEVGALGRAFHVRGMTYFSDNLPEGVKS